MSYRMDDPLGLVQSPEDDRCSDCFARGISTPATTVDEGDDVCDACAEMRDVNPIECDHEDSHDNGHGARECNTCGSSIVDGWVHPPHGEMFTLASAERCDTCGRHTGGSCACQNCGACASGLLFCADCDMTEADI